MGSNPTQGMDVCVYSVGSGLARIRRRRRRVIAAYFFLPTVPETVTQISNIRQPRVTHLFAYYSVLKHLNMHYT
jgi:hypothetical protein